MQHIQKFRSVVYQCPQNGLIIAVRISLFYTSFLVCNIDRHYYNTNVVDQLAPLMLSIPDFHARLQRCESLDNPTTKP